MFLDRQNKVSDAQALTATAASTDFIDLGIERRIGTGEPMCFVVSCDVAMGGTSPTLTIAVQSDDNAGFSSAATVVAHPQLSALPAGARVVIPLAPGALTERFVRLNYTLGGTSPTVTLTAHLQPMNMLQGDFYYADALTIA